MNAKILLSGNWDISKIKTQIDGTYQPNIKLMEHIHKVWKKHIKKYPKSFNGPMARLKKWQENNGVLTLSFEETNYASYVATRNKDFINKFLDINRANSLGITIIVSTSDNKYIVGKRSLFTDQNPGKLYFIGGYVQTNISKYNQNILKNSIINEVKEELNVDKKYIDKITAKCLIYNKVFYHPEIFIIVNLKVSSNFVIKKYPFANDANEIEKLFFYKKSLLIQQYKNNQLPSEPTLGFKVAIKYL